MNLGGNMKECISIKTDYSLLQSVIQISNLLSYAKKEKIETLGIIDDNLSSSAEFLNGCEQNNIKAVIGLSTTFNDKDIILYARSYQGLKGLFKLNTFLLDNELNIIELTKYIQDLVILIPYQGKDIFHDIEKICLDTFIGFSNESEKRNALLITQKVIPFELALAIYPEDTKYLNYLKMIKDGLDVNSYENKDHSNSYLKLTDVSSLTKLINIIPEKNDNLIPHFDEAIKDSYQYLEALAVKGLNKRLHGRIPNAYKERLLYELKTIKEMGYVDYFLIVYDYIKFAVNNDILVGPGRGSAAGSLVTYSLGITAVDPLKYGLLFERFLNPERISMPDIDIDFDAEGRGYVIDHVKEKYGEFNTLSIMTYGTMAAKQVLISVAKILDLNIDHLLKHIDAFKTLKENLTPEVKKILTTNTKIKHLYYDAMRLEGLKKHISTHAAGVVIANTELDNVIPLIKSGNVYLTGYTMYYLEELGLLKMDFLAVRDLTTIADILKMITEKINIKEIEFNDKEVLNRFSTANTIGIFQFESTGMKNFLRKLKPSVFNDLVVVLALYRPGPMQNIDTFIARKEGREKIDYLVPELEPVLKETFGIIVYQEQIMQIFNIIAGYTIAEADIIRKAISKKQEDIIIKEKERFIKGAVKNNYSKEKAEEIYLLIIRFANYGFPKAHAVAYAMFAYQMMYLKVKYPKEFYVSLLNINMGSSSKTKEYLDEAKSLNIKILKPDINKSTKNYLAQAEGIRMPLNIIKNIGEAAASDIVTAREKENYQDLFDFISRTYGKSVNTKTTQNLIYGGAFDEFNETRATLIKNISNGVIYAELTNGLDSSLVVKPSLEIADEFPADELMNKELELFGFYVSNHPASKYNEVKINEVTKYFDKIITTVGLLEKIKTIKTKKNDTMAFLEISDETGKLEYCIFPNRIDYANRIKKGDLLKIIGKVEKRFDKYQIVVNSIEVIKL